MATDTIATGTIATESMATNIATPHTTPPATATPNPEANLGALPQEIKERIFDQLMLDPGFAPSRKLYACAVDSSTRLRPLASWANFARVKRKFHASADRWLQDTHELVLVKIRWRKLVEYLDDCRTKDTEFISSTKQALAFERRGMAATTVEITGPVDSHAPLVAFVSEPKSLDKFYAIVPPVTGQIVNARHVYSSATP
ncbi:hypothetical protein B0A48_17650 [Cryoendolithus antarcticus]|uniref:Uncharacterized protein n=1 Tax=Cryoendolithus antarcticus TaxID=1507870 RepID=A0A1V8SB26_9PEZI|nr:hypothetical protein B0A48_17650 [Cryoendolithus antarcticus]